MADPQQTSGAGQRFVINVIGMIGLVFGFVPIVRYLLDLDLFAFTVAPYEWLELEGAARYLPPAVVLVACVASTYWLERRLQRG